ncbi:hypothetical protein Q0F98_38330 [Paenibacillus amylolyticus]|nr:hypothetical protein Q0F98_38330 [Paenibacillus amylolyticus]
MNITHMKTNHITNPLGFVVIKPTFSYTVTDTTATTQIVAQVEISLNESFTELVFDSGITEDMDSLSYSPGSGIGCTDTLLLESSSMERAWRKGDQ